MQSANPAARIAALLAVGVLGAACAIADGGDGSVDDSDEAIRACNKKHPCDAGVDSGTDTGTDSGTDTGTDAGTTTTFPLGTICNASGTARARPAVLKHVIVFMFENKDYSQVMGSANAPYMNSIKDQCGYSTQFRDNVFPSDINSLSHYMAVTSGSNCNTGIGTNGTGCITDDNGPSSHQLSTVSIMEQAASYKGYIEAMPSNCYGSTSGAYAPKHNPPPYYTRLASTCSTRDLGLPSVTCPTTANATCATPSNVFTQDLANDTLPAYSFVTPNLINDMHDGTVTQGDNWMHTYLPLVLKSPAYLRGEVAVYIMWDEQGTFTGGAQPNIFVSPYIAPTVSSTTMNLFSVLRATEAQLGITSYLGCAGGTPPGGIGTCPTGSTTDLRSIFNF